jgi:putative membrane protein
MTSPSIWLPYCGAAPNPAELLGRWNLDPLLILALAMVGLAILRAGLNTRERRLAGIALGLTFILFVSPLCALTSALFAARSAHHVLLTAALAPLIAWAIPRRRLASLPGKLPLWTAASAVALWFWHAPDFYAAALSSDVTYWAMQMSLLGTATAFWIGVRRTAPAHAIVALLTYMVQMGLLGALLTFSTNAFYAPHALTTSIWGLSPLEDQQLGGMIMWVPGALAYLLGALILLARLLDDNTERAAT